MDYRDKIYSQCVPGTTEHLYGKMTLADIKKSFSAWSAYYGKVLPAHKNAAILEAVSYNKEARTLKIRVFKNQHPLT